MFTPVLLTGCLLLANAYVLRLRHKWHKSRGNYSMPYNDKILYSTLIVNLLFLAVTLLVLLCQYGE